MKHKICLILSEDSINILENYAFFHNTTIDDVAEGAIMMMPFHEKRSQQIYDFMM